MTNSSYPNMLNQVPASPLMQPRPAMPMQGQMGGQPNQMGGLWHKLHMLKMQKMGGLR